MSIWTIVLCVLFGIGIIIFAILAARESSHNKGRSSANRLIPFAGYLSPPSDYWNTAPKGGSGSAPTPKGGLFLTGLTGGNGASPQIQCPVGSKINIVGAYVEVNDPYGECSVTSPSATFSLSCGDSSAISTAQTCASASDCPIGMDCENNRCLPLTCTANSQCIGDGTAAQVCPVGVGVTGCTDHTRGGPDGTDARLVCVNSTWAFDPAYGQCMMCSTGGKCMNVPLCSGTTKTSGVFQNSRCTQGDCKIRDASSYLAKHCDGNSQCLGDSSDMWIPDTPGGAFGPLPCSINTTDPDYTTLPVIPGWNAGVTPHGGGTPVLANFSQGYYVHGIYTCIPDSETGATT